MYALFVQSGYSFCRAHRQARRLCYIVRSGRDVCWVMQQPIKQPPYFPEDTEPMRRWVLVHSALALLAFRFVRHFRHCPGQRCRGVVAAMHRGHIIWIFVLFTTFPVCIFQRRTGLCFCACRPDFLGCGSALFPVLSRLITAADRHTICRRRAKHIGRSSTAHQKNRKCSDR